MFRAKKLKWFQEKSLHSWAGIFWILVRSGKHYCHIYFGQYSTEKFTKAELTPCFHITLHTKRVILWLRLILHLRWVSFMTKLAGNHYAQLIAWWLSLISVIVFVLSPINFEQNLSLFSLINNWWNRSFFLWFSYTSTGFSNQTPA